MDVAFDGELSGPIPSRASPGWYSPSGIVVTTVREPEHGTGYRVKRRTAVRTVRPGNDYPAEVSLLLPLSDTTETSFIRLLVALPVMQSSVLTRVLCRTDLMRGQITLLKLLYERDEPIGREELAEKLRGEIHQNPEQSLTGVLGAFGKRVNETENISGGPGTGAFIKRERIGGETHYSLRPEAREAIENIPALIAKFDEPWNELLEPDTRIEAADLATESN